MQYNPDGGQPRQCRKIQLGTPDSTLSTTSEPQKHVINNTLCTGRGYGGRIERQFSKTGNHMSGTNSMVLAV
eukprot:2499658-Rhodomonas_salina.1